MDVLKKTLVAGSRGSTLALKQTQTVIEQLKAAKASLVPSFNVELRIIKTQGDHIQNVPLANIGGKGVFTKELEQSLLDRSIDFAVHSLKDLPVELPGGLTIAAYLPRERPNDVLISRAGQPLRELPQGATVATGSLRRKFQLLQVRPDFQIVDVRGNIETRIDKLSKNNWDGLILAYAALHRLGKTDLITEIIPAETLYPAVGQGIIAIESRAEPEWHTVFAALNHSETERCARAERAFLSGLGGGCQVPVGVISNVQDGQIFLSGVYLPAEGHTMIKAQAEGNADQPEQAGAQLASSILQQYRGV